MHFKNIDNAPSDLYVTEATKGQSKKEGIKFIFTRDLRNDTSKFCDCEGCFLRNYPNICNKYSCVDRFGVYYIANEYKDDEFK